MLKSLYECLIYTLIRGYIHRYGGNPAFVAVKRNLDYCYKCWLYKVLKHII